MCSFLYPPEDGWPDFLFKSYIYVTANVGYTIAGEGVDPVRRAVIMATREFYENASQVAAQRALDTTLNPIIRYN